MAAVQKQEVAEVATRGQRALELLTASMEALRRKFEALAEMAASRDFHALDQEVRKLCSDAEGLVAQSVKILKTRAAAHKDLAQEMITKFVAEVEAGAQRVRTAAADRVASTPALAKAADTVTVSVTGARERVAAGRTRVGAELEKLSEWAERTTEAAKKAALDAAAPASAWAGEAQQRLGVASSGALAECQKFVEGRSPDAYDKLSICGKELADAWAQGVGFQTLLRVFVTVLLVMQACLFLAFPAAAEWAVWGPSPPPSPLPADRPAAACD
eukprot:TRINITY_DN914_c3_g2_i2.p1 TRINITY_DN914_c3_g2~~TRINITY_DN914_c3_g2_i2.p1  ORF type:complete len:273 (+),score=125.25 TRINITY_DN914_c3_g2_i2:77-895(+)